ncbi:MAG: hypothetical protein ACRC7W_05150 [Fusobacteriaceae bacterium]
MNKFKQGDKIKCHNAKNLEKWIAWGKEYEVLAIGRVVEFNMPFVEIIADNKKVMRIPESNFMLSTNWEEYEEFINNR